MYTIYVVWCSIILIKPNVNFFVLCGINAGCIFSHDKVHWQLTSVCIPFETTFVCLFSD